MLIRQVLSQYQEHPFLPARCHQVQRSQCTYVQKYGSRRTGQQYFCSSHLYHAKEWYQRQSHTWWIDWRPVHLPSTSSGSVLTMSQAVCKFPWYSLVLLLPQSQGKICSCQTHHTCTTCRHYHGQVSTQRDLEHWTTWNWQPVPAFGWRHCTTMPR